MRFTLRPHPTPHQLVATQEDVELSMRSASRATRDKAAEKNKRYTRRDEILTMRLDSLIAGGSPLLFELQAIMDHLSGGVHAYEVLYRGKRQPDWSEVDRTMIAFLQTSRDTLPSLFVNIANDTLLKHAEDELIQAARMNDVHFEISEALSDDTTFEQIVKKVNRLAEHGVRFALDDFGSGMDGLKRLNALDAVRVIKFDGVFLRQAAANEHAIRVIQALIAQWQDRAILTVAEGVETQGELLFAKSMSIDLLQGFHIDHLLRAQTKRSTTSTTS